MARRYKYRVTVAGRSGFPIDMLRYDRATPLTESDSTVIAATLRPVQERQEREVAVLTEREPTIGRWASFGWTVRKTEKIEVS
jgi:hypothetical protein